VVLRGRRNEREVLDRELQHVLAGQSLVRVLRGEAGVGKTALLEYVAERASGCRIARAAGVQSEMELAFAGVHQLCAPMLDRLDRLPGPQRDALRVAFALRDGGAPEHFLVALAVLSLLAEAAEARPLVCLVDDAQWLDRASAQVLAFVARRLLAERIAMVFAVREPSDRDELAGLPEMVIEGIADDDARALLASVIPGVLDERVRDRILAETRGNPLALIELPHGLTPAELAGGFGLLDAGTLSGRIEQSFLRRVESLPPDSQRLVLTAAAEPVGDVTLLWRAADRLGIGADAVAPVVAAELIALGAHVRFRHPLVRSAVYQAAPLYRRREVHRALAEATDPESDPDRRAWHRAHAAAGFDEAVAAELERSAGRAQARGGVAAAAAFLERAAELTPDSARRGARALAAAQAKFESAAPDAAYELLAAAEMCPLDELQRGRLARLRAEIVFALRRGSDAPPLLLDAARQLEALDPALARETYLEALGAAMYAGRLYADSGVRKAAEAARAAPAAPKAPRSIDLVLDGMARRFAEGPGAGVPPLRLAVEAFRNEALERHGEIMRWLLLCPIVRSGRPDVAASALPRLEERTRAAGTDWALGLLARSRALVSEGDLADTLYCEAIERLERTRIRVELARARLLYGEWLRRENRRLDAREQLRIAHDTFSRIGAEAFAERARRELLATGETARRRTEDTRDVLTPQEAQIARLARDRHTNPEIGAQLFISPRTVEYHLRKVFAKLDITSRKELRHALAGAAALPGLHR
jgi:DNA-binding CsgD family transcriptional regulator